MRLLACFLALTAAIACFAQKPSGARSAIEREMARLDKAMAAKDLKTLGSMMTSDFQTTMKNGSSQGLKDYLAGFKGFFRDASQIRSRTSLLSFRFERGTAFLVCRNSLDADLKNRSGKIVKYHNESKTDEVWVPSAGIYKVKSVKEIEGKQTVDGKAIG